MLQKDYWRNCLEKIINFDPFCLIHSTMPVLQPRTFMLWKTKYITEILEMSAIRFSSQFWPQWWWHPELQPDCRQPLFWIEFGGLDCDIIWKSPSFGAVMKNETKHHNNKSQIRHTMILLKSKQRGQKNWQRLCSWWSWHDHLEEYCVKNRNQWMTRIPIMYLVFQSIKVLGWSTGIAPWTALH